MRAVVRYQPGDRPATAAACLAILGAEQTVLPPIVEEPRIVPSTPAPVHGAIGAAAGGALTAASILIFLIGFGLASSYAEPTADASIAYRTEPIEVVATGGTVGPPERHIELGMPAPEEKKKFLGGLFSKSKRRR